MAEVLLYNRKVETVFDLLGTKEDDISSSFAWCMKSSPQLLKLLIIQITGMILKKEELSDVRILLQATENQKGRTDFEILLPNVLAIIAEAKKGWVLPSEKQLVKYADRKVFSNVKTKIIVSLSECKKFYADCYLPKIIKDIPVLHLSFSTVNNLLKKAKKQTNSIHEKNILSQFGVYLNKIYRMQKLDSNLVYVVSLGTGFPEKWKLSWIDIVVKEGRYFHPVGNGYPHEPPNYIAFRYHGVLQSIHHIVDYEVSKNLSTVFPGKTASTDDHKPYFVYTLGPAFRPDKVVKTGKKIYRGARKWCMLDTLFTSETISEAFEVSRMRWEIIQRQ